MITKRDDILSAIKAYISQINFPSRRGEEAEWAWWGGLRAGVTKRVREICPPEDAPTDCFLRPIYENSMFCLPPCTAGAGYGPCEVPRSTWAQPPRVVVVRERRSGKYFGAGTALRQNVVGHM